MSERLIPGTEREFAGIIFCWIPPGEFMMGSPEDEKDRDSNEGPQHLVTIDSGFWLGKYPVTEKQWKDVMGDIDEIYSDNSLFPIDSVSWDECQEFIGKLNSTGQGVFRLPTEAEWEYACRAGTTTRFYWGDDLNYEKINDYAWHEGNSGSKERPAGYVHPVGERHPNAWGLHDMLGNINEWCEDSRHDDYVGAPTDDRAWLESPWKSHHMARGGCWDCEPESCRSASRSSSGILDFTIGFRLAFSEVK